MVVTTVGALALPAAHGPDGSRSMHEVFVFDAPDNRDGLSRVAEAYMLPGSIFLLAGRRTVYDRFVVTGLVVLAVWHLVAILMLRSVPELEFRFTQLALLLTPAYLFAAFWTAVASLRR